VSAAVQSGYVRIGRLNKVNRLVATIDSACVGQLDPVRDGVRVAKMLTGWADEDWSRAALLAGVRPPSEETRLAVVARYLERAGGGL
jgi:hypothetical protein